MTDIGELLPHAGDARMIERLLQWNDAEICVATTRHRAPGNPLRHEGRLAAVHLAEFAAQAMALHGGLRTAAAGGRPQPALLVSVRDFEMKRDYLDDLDGELEITATVLLASAGNWQYSFIVRHAGAVIATGRVAAMATDRPQAAGSKSSG